ncbi:acyl-CoA dehydrogenase family member 11-like [Stegodyphus dumicola]|uniref:acyl-CoA dehydrogenase family member 11-like n=1 Tax=Stegodyphus dumicola TaxID=202533 RepID=UPI0015AC4A4F|nr:acyl-CoA dehydrogenase family member 11-like [Stegodyphus dumicola]
MLARDYSQRRVAFGQTIANFPLHMQVLSRMEVEIRGSLLLLLKVAILLGKSELGVATVDELLLLRLMSPVLKMYTAKQAVSVVSEGLEVFGGQGYMEDSRLPVIFRDCQVLPIWEGTTSVLSMDVVRSFSKTRYEVLSALHRSIISSIENAKQNPDLKDACLKVETSIKHITGFVEKFSHLLNVAAKDISFSIARTYIGALLIENVWLTKNLTDLTAARRYVY